MRTVHEYVSILILARPHHDGACLDIYLDLHVVSGVPQQEAAVAVCAAATTVVCSDSVSILMTDLARVSRVRLRAEIFMFETCFFILSCLPRGYFAHRHDGML